MNKLILFAIVLFILTGCKKDYTDPEPPIISFGGWKYLEKDADGQDILIELVVNFKDRNGDIGRFESEKKDKCGRSVNDLFIYYEKKINNAYVPAYWNVADSVLDNNCVTIPGSLVPITQINFLRSLDYLQPEGNNRSIEGEIAYRLDYESSLVNLFSVGRCRIYIIDRAGNKSNEIFTDDLVLH